MRLLVLLLLAPLIPGARENAISLAEAQDGWILLFDSQTAFGWTGATNRWTFDNNAMTCDASSGLLRTTSPFSDYSLKLEFFEASDAASLFFRMAADGKPRETGYELKLGNSDPQWPAGSIAGVAKGTGLVAANRWHTLQLDTIGDSFTVSIDGNATADGKDERAKAGYIGLQCGGGRDQFRNIKLKPLALQPLFDGVDLSGWKSVGTPPAKPKGSGLLSRIGKVLAPMPAPKEKQAEWSVKEDAIHGVKGPGQLESQLQFDNFVLQIAARAPDRNKDQMRTAIVFRGDAGQLASGYSVPLDNSKHSGGVAGLQTPRETLALPGSTVFETIVASGRHIGVWMDGYPVTDWTDTRVDASSPKSGARTAAGPIALEAPSSDSDVNFREVSVSSLPKDMGKQKQTVAAVPPAPMPIPPPPIVPAAAPSQGTAPQTNPAQDLIAMQARQQAESQAKQAQVANLMSQALRSNNSAEQASLYGRILDIDPNNVPAAEGYKDAQQKTEQARAQQQQRQEQQARQSEDQANKQQQLQRAMGQGQTAFVHGDLARAMSQLSIAERIAPGNPAVQALRQRVNGAYSLQERVRWIAGGGGVVALLAGLVYLWRRRGRGGRNRHAVLEVVDGIDKGKRFNLDGAVSHIGAVTQDGGARNEIVLRDAERMVSRFHCEIHRRENQLFVVDCNSSNGTFVDNKRIPSGKPVRLRNGSRVELGRTCALQVRFERNGGSRA